MPQTRKQNKPAERHDRNQGQGRRLRNGCIAKKVSDIQSIFATGVPNSSRVKFYNVSEY